MTPGRLKIWNADAGEWQYTPGGSQPGTVAPLQYVEWGPDDTTKTLTFPPGTQVYAAWLVVEEAFDGDHPAFTFGPGDAPDAWASGALLDAQGVLFTVTDLQGGTAPSGLAYGFPFTNDAVVIFPTGGTIVGVHSYTTGGGTMGRLRFYFLACIPSEATTT